MTAPSQANIRASCYVADAVTTALSGFHYSTTRAGGMLKPPCPFTAPADAFTQEYSGGPEVTTQGLTTPPESPPLAARASANEQKPTRRSGGRPARARGGGGGASYTITGECERLFCETLRAVFLGEGKTARGPLGMGACCDLGRRGSCLSAETDDGAVAGLEGLASRELPSPPADAGLGAVGRISDHTVVQWLEIWDYAGGAMFRGFVTQGVGGEQTLYVFFERGVIGRDLKQGLMALIELASSASFACEQIVVCFDREDDTSAPSMNLLRDLGWVGFELATLAHWSRGIDLTSERWLFLCMEV